MTNSWIQINGKLVPKDEYYGDNTRNQTHMVAPEFKEFVSPVTGEIVTSRNQLRDHNRKQGVTNLADYKDGYIQDRAKDIVNKQEREGKSDRIEQLIRATDRR